MRIINKRFLSIWIVFGCFSLISSEAFCWSQTAQIKNESNYAWTVKASGNPFGGYGWGGNYIGTNVDSITMEKGPSYHTTTYVTDEGQSWGTIQIVDQNNNVMCQWDWTCPVKQVLGGTECKSGNVIISNISSPNNYCNVFTEDGSVSILSNAKPIS